MGAPIPWQQFMKPSYREAGDSREHVGEPGLRIDVIELGGHDQGRHPSGRNVGAALKAPVRACRRQTVSKLGCTSCRRAISMTLAPGVMLSSTIRRFSVVVRRRRRSGPDRTATLLTFAHLLANQSANYRSHVCRPEGGPHRRITL
jgi:hypothetical protein